MIWITEIDIESYLTPRKNTPRELASGNIDFSIDPSIYSDASLRHQKSFEEKYVLIVRKGHPITKKKKITMDDYLALSHVHISNRRLGLGNIDRLFTDLVLTEELLSGLNTF